MDEPDDLLAQDAVERLILLGWPVMATGDDVEQWRVGHSVFSNAELLEFAAWMGIALAETGDAVRGE